ncbi:MAG: glycosyltransferase family 2 protein [Deltaproteobacteria bacterium]|nr:glycosyltransferase family 2 protein [Deltaproteobacteria bacterium]
MESRNPLTFVILLTWNRWEDTEACLRSLLPVVDGNIRVLVVDNGSTDGTPENIRRRFPRFAVHENGINLGFPAGNNAGIRLALAEGADYVILLNNDTVVDSGFAEELVAAARRNPSAGMVNSLIFFHDRPGVVWFAGGGISTWTGRSRHAGYLQSDRGQFTGDVPIDRPCACSLLVTRRFLETVGLMREGLFLYGEEIDWMLRARRLGFRCILATRSKVWHKVSSSTKASPHPVSLYYSTRNMLAVLRDEAPKGRVLGRIRDFVVLTVFLGAVFRLDVAWTGGVRNVLRGYRDYRKGISGPQ